MQTTTTAATAKRTNGRQSKEQQRNAKAQAAYRGIRELGFTSNHPALEGFSMPSQSQLGVRYTVAHDMVTDRFHCDCPHGQYGGRGECVHILAVRRKVDEKRAQWQAAYERDQRAGGCYGYNDTLNYSYGTQASSDY